MPTGFLVCVLGKTTVHLYAEGDFYHKYSLLQILRAPIYMYCGKTVMWPASFPPRTVQIQIVKFNILKNSNGTAITLQLTVDKRKRTSESYISLVFSLYSYLCGCDYGVGDDSYADDAYNDAPTTAGESTTATTSSISRCINGFQTTSRIN